MGAERNKARRSRALMWRLFLSPVFPSDEDKTRQAARLNRVVLAAAALYAVYLALSPIVSPLDHPNLVLPSVFVLAATWVLMRYGFVQSASAFLISSLWLLQTMRAVSAGGIRAPTFGVYFVTVLLAGLLVGRYGSFIFAILSSLAGLAMAYAETKGLLGRSAAVYTPVGMWLIYNGWFILTAAILHMATSDLRAALRRARDEVDERKRAEAATRDSEERFSKAFHASPAPMSISKDGLLIYVNESFLAISGYTRSEAIGQTPVELGLLNDPGDLARVRELLAKQGAVRNLEMDLRMKDGQVRTHLVSADSIELDGATCVLMVGIDISDRKLAETALKQSETRFREFFEDSLTGDYISTPEGKLLACNPALVRMLGFSSTEEAMQCDTRSLYPDQKQREYLLTELSRRGRFESQEIELRRRDGAPLFVVQNAIGVFDDRGELIQVKGYMFDVTERRELEHRLLQSQKIEAIGRLAGGIAHDFNNILTAIIAYSQLMLRRLVEGDQLHYEASQILSAAQRAAELTGQLLAFSRRQVLQPVVCDLNAVVADIAPMLRPIIREDVELITLLEPELGSVKADPVQLQQVIMNLVVNARDAMSEGGQVTIQTGNVHLGDDDDHALTAHRPGPHVLLAVSDTGCGMDEDTQARIFEPFFTTKEKGKGTGLGLSTVYGIVKQSGGTIALRSKPGQGTTVKVYFPLSREAADFLAEVEDTDFPTGTETILLVEDDPLVRELAVGLLREQGYTVLEASDGEEAVYLCRHLNNEIHLVITDLVMPRMGGRGLAAYLRDARPDAKVLFVSGYTEDVFRELVSTAAADFLQKPFTPGGLARKVRQVLDINPRALSQRDPQKV